MSACADTFIFPETTPVSVVVIKLKRSSLSSHIKATLVLEPLSVTNPESKVLATPDPTPVFNAKIGSSVAILTVSVKLPWTVKLPERVISPVTARVDPLNVRFPLSSSSPAVPAITTRLSVRSETFADASVAAVVILTFGVVRVLLEPSKVRFASTDIAEVPLPVSILFAVIVASPVPP